MRRRGSRSRAAGDGSIRRRCALGGGRLAVSGVRRSRGQRPHARHRRPAAGAGRQLCAGHRPRRQPAGQGAGRPARWPIRASRRPTAPPTALRIKRPETALLPALACRARPRWRIGRPSVDARLSAGTRHAASRSRARARSPQGTAPVQHAPARPTSRRSRRRSALSVRNIAGTLRPDLTLEHQRRRRSPAPARSRFPTATLASADERHAADRRARRDRRCRATRCSSSSSAFQTGAQRQISATGTVRLDPAQGFPVDLAVTSAASALVANRPDLLATVSSELKIDGLDSLSGFDVAGPVTIDRAEISHRRRAGRRTIRPSQVREINGRRARSRAAAAASAAPAPAAAAAGHGVRLALAMQAPQAVFVRGRGLDAEVGGQFTVTGDPDGARGAGRPHVAARRLQPAAAAGSVSRRGNVSLANVERHRSGCSTSPPRRPCSGRPSRSTSPAPRARPRSRITSSPALPQDEAMAMLLFGKPSSGLSPIEIAECGAGAGRADRPRAGRRRLSSAALRGASASTSSR